LQVAKGGVRRVGRSDRRQRWGWHAGIQHFDWTDKTGKAQQVTVRVTDVFHKVDGQWKVIHTHISAPMDPKTGLTQTNLKS